MQFLIDADLPRRLKALLQQYGHQSVDVRDVSLGDATDAEIAAFAQARQLCLLTGDFGFADVRKYPPGDYSGLVVLSLPRFATAAAISNLLETLLKQEIVVQRLSGRLAILEFGRIRLRPV